MAYQSEIELRVKVVDQDLKALEQQIKKIETRAKAVNPFSASGASKENKKALDLQQRLMATEKARLNVDKNRLQLNIDLNQQRIKSINLNTSWYKALQTGKEIQLDINKAVAKEAQLRKQATAKRRNRLGEDLALGVGFPLLFGGGAGSVIGGAAGALAGAGGGGFGLQILGSAIGQQVDAFIQATTEAGVALTSTGGALEFVREKALFSSAENEELAAKLEEQGDAAGLSALLTQELADKIGNQGVEALSGLGTETENVTKLWNELTLQLQSLIAGPLSDFLSLIGDLLGEQVAFNRLSRLQQDLAGTDEGKRLDAAVAGLKAPGTVELGDGRTVEDPFAFTNQFTGAAATELFNQFEKFRPKPASGIPVTDQDRRSIKPPKGKQEKDRLPSLNIELGLKERLLGLNKQIAQAVLEEDKVNETLLEKEKARETLAAKIDKIKAKGLKSDVEAAEIAIARVDAAQQIQDIDNKTAQFKARQAEKGQEVISSLEDEKALLEAKLNGTEDQVALTQLIAEKTEGLTEEDAKRVTELLKGVDALKQQNEQADKMQAIYDQIGQSIASGVVDTLSAAVDQTESLADAAANTLRNIANTLLQLGVNTALGAAFPGSSLFKNLSGFAGGGRPPVNKPSIVGERGPELFVPSTSGTIVPSGKFGGATNVVVNVDAKGTSASGSDGSAKQLGGLIGAAVQAELVKQQRPGGLLAR